MPGLTGIGACRGWQWLPVVLAWAVSLYFVWRRVCREENRAGKNFGDLPVYQDYIRTTPVLIPFVPLYSFNRKKEND